MTGKSEQKEKISSGAEHAHAAFEVVIAFSIQ